jgi:hypothetical protein
MKKILVIAMVAFMSVSAFAQGTVNFNTVGKNILTAPEKGGTPIATPAQGGTVMGALFYGPAGVTDTSAFTQAGAAVNAGPLAGWLSGGTRALDGIALGGSANVVVRVWDTADPNHVGESAVVTLTTGGGGVPAALPTNLSGLFTGFQMEIVPEPSVFALGALGAGALLLLRRRK